MHCPDKKTAQQLTAITERLVNTIMVDQIYLSRYEYQGTCHQELTILLPHTNRQLLVEAKPMVGMVMETHSHVRYRLYYAHEVWQCMRNGSIPFLYRCHPENVLYIHPESDCMLSIDAMPPARALKKAKAALRLEERKTGGFRESVQFHLEKGNYQSFARSCCTKCLS